MGKAFSFRRGISQSPSPPPVPRASTTTSAKDYDAELDSVFDSLDADGDGRISASELQVMFRCTATEAEEMVASVDSDGDGFISREEFRALLEDGESDAVRTAFAVFDENGDGKITAEELCRGLREALHQPNLTVEKCYEMIAGVDKDGDGLVSFDEFKAMMATKIP